MRGRFGDPHLLDWRARPKHHTLWQDPADVVGPVARLNAMEAIMERSSDAARMTLLDPRLHPRMVQWEPPGGSNLRKFELRESEDSLGE